MIDIENELYTEFAVALRNNFQGIDVSSEYVPQPNTFPHVTIMETDNYQTAAHRDTSDKERLSSLMYQVDVYSNKKAAKKTECKNIIQFIDEMFFARNFTRQSVARTPNMQDATIYRITARYRAETDGTYIYKL